VSRRLPDSCPALVGFRARPHRSRPPAGDPAAPDSASRRRDPRHLSSPRRLPPQRRRGRAASSGARTLRSRAARPTGLLALAAGGDGKGEALARATVQGLGCHRRPVTGTAVVQPIRGRRKAKYPAPERGIWRWDTHGRRGNGSHAIQAVLPRRTGERTAVASTGNRVGPAANRIRIAARSEIRGPGATASVEVAGRWGARGAATWGRTRLISVRTAGRDKRTATNHLAHRTAARVVRVGENAGHARDGGTGNGWAASVRSTTVARPAHPAGGHAAYRDAGARAKRSPAGAARARHTARGGRATGRCRRLDLVLAAGQPEDTCQQQCDCDGCVLHRTPPTGETASRVPVLFLDDDSDFFGSSTILLRRAVRFLMHPSRFSR